jgi:hypothetical protein
MLARACQLALLFINHASRFVCADGLNFMASQNSVFLSDTHTKNGPALHTAAATPDAP